jgi:hypothetical protein
MSGKQPLPYRPECVCRVLLNGVLLYADEDHFSVAGCRFVAEKALKDYLSKGTADTPLTSREKTP